MRVLVYGLAVAGESVARALRRRGHDVVIADDVVTAERSAVADELGAPLHGSPSAAEIDALVESCDLVCPSPGVPETHAVVEGARRHGTELVSEIELAYRWEAERAGGARPMLAVTGTDGKTTTTLLAVEMLRAAGLRTVAAGNTDTPLVEAIDEDLDAFVVECTSFRLAWTHDFRAEAAAWLNLAPDHLNWHRSMASYEAAKARIFSQQRPTDASIGHADDPVVVRHLATTPARPLAFGLSHGDYRVVDEVLTGPAGPIAPLSSMRRRLPHDITNALAASAMVLESGLATPAAIEEALSRFAGPPHRLESVGRWRDIEWFDDSKATTPHAAATAIRGFERIVLIAGGYDKGVDLTPMTEHRDRIHTVLAIGDTAPSVRAAFTTPAGRCGSSALPDVEIAGDMATAVRLAAARARAGDVVLLSPGCASFDQYTGFEERGDHFRALVHELHENRQEHSS